MTPPNNTERKLRRKLRFPRARAESGGTPEEPVIRCYNIESGYGQMVTQDLIDKAIEEQS